MEDQKSNTSQVDLLVRPPDFDVYEWLCTGNGEIYLLGHNRTNIIQDAKAGVCKSKNGSWNWTIFCSPFCGNEPTRKDAKKAVYNAYFPEAI